MSDSSAKDGQQSEGTPPRRKSGVFALKNSWHAVVTRIISGQRGYEAVGRFIRSI